MAFSILIITPVRSFGELICQALQEVGYQQAEIFATGMAALESLRLQPRALVVLDLEIRDIQPQTIVQLMRENWPTTRLVAVSIHTDKTEYDPELVGLLDACLPTPFYLPDMIEAVGSLAPVQSKTSLQVAPVVPDRPIVRRDPQLPRREPEWLKDDHLATQSLTRLSLESNAQATLIARCDQLWAYAGQLSQEAAQELACLVSSCSRGEAGSDYVRYVHLESAAGEVLLYATALGGDFVLALAFETELPFSKIRAQAAELVRNLSAPPDKSFQHKTCPPPDDRQGEIDRDSWPVDPHEWLPEDDLPAGFPLSTAGGAILPEGRQAFLEDMLATIDVPEPGQVADLPGAASLQPRPSPGTRTAQLAEQRKQRIQQSSTAGPDPDRQTAGLSSLTNIHHLVTYAGLMVPRLPKHRLFGSLPTLLSEKIQQLCLANDWCLRHLVCRPDHVYWVISVPSETSSAVLVESLCQQTSALAFDVQPHLVVDQPGKDFWVVGYLRANADQPLVPDAIQEFLKNIRHYQGLASQED